MYREHTTEQAVRFKETCKSVKARGFRRKRKTSRPTREDLEAFCPELLQCPFCWEWSVRAGYMCALCGEDSQGRAMSQQGEYK